MLLLTSIDVERYLQISSSWLPLFGKDGRFIIYMTNLTGEPQAWKLNLPNGCPSRLTYEVDGIDYAVPSKKDDSFIYVADKDGTERTQIYLYDPETGEITKVVGDERFIYRFGDWSKDGRFIYFTTNEDNFRDFHVKLIDLEAKKKRTLVDSSGTWAISSLSPSGRYLALLRYITNLLNEVYIYDLKEGRLKKLLEADALYRDLNWKDDSTLFMITDKDNDFRYIAIYKLGRGLHAFRKFNWDVENIALSKDGRKLYYSLNEYGYSKAKVLDLETGKEQDIPLKEGVIYSPSFSPDGNYLVFAYSSTYDNMDIYLFNLKEGKLRKLTNSPTAGIPESTFRKAKLVKYRSFDGLEISGFLYLPEGKPPFPTILYFHGGPESQIRPYFSSVFQFFLSRGYAIFAPNIRGSTGFGKSFTHMDDVEKRFDALKDGEYAYRFLKENGISSKVCVMGASYGGYMTLAMLSFYPELFDCGISIVGIANLITFLNKTSSWRRHLRIAEYGDPDKHADILRKLSPVFHAHRIKAPLLVIHGKNDPRVPYEEAEQIVEALRRNNIPVEYLLFEDEGHGISKLENRIEAYRKIESFLERYLHD